jgi:hypothetical protein
MSAPATPPSGNTNPPPPTPHFNGQELMDIVNAVPQSASALTAGGPAGGKMVRIVAGKGLSQAENAAAIEEGRDYIQWYFGQGSYTLNRRQNTGTWVIFEGIGAALLNAPYPIYALHSDGRIFRGSSQHLIFTGNTGAFEENYNSSPQAGPNKVQVFQGGKWVIVP